MSKSGRERRRSPRVAIELPLELRTDEVTHSAVAWVANEHGLAVLSPVGYPVGEQVVIREEAGWSGGARVVSSQIDLASRDSIRRRNTSWNVVFTLGLELSQPHPALSQQARKR